MSVLLLFLYTFNYMGLDETSQLSKKIIDWLRLKQLYSFTKTEFVKRFNKYPKVRDEALTNLIDREIIRELPKDMSSSTKGVIRYEINPKMGV